MKLYVVRHGQTNWNKIGIYQGDTDISLNEEGKVQALLIKEKLKGKKIDLCISSPLKRAIETASIILDNKIPILTSNLIIERDLGIYEGKAVNDRGYNGKIYWDYQLNSNANGVEPIQDLFKRVTIFLDKVKKNYDNKDILIISHGATIRAINYVINGFTPDENFLKFDVGNCSLFEYDI